MQSSEVAKESMNRQYLSFLAEGLFSDSSSMTTTTILLDTAAIERALTRIAHEIRERNGDNNNVVLIGIPRGGIHLARRLSGLLSAAWRHPVAAGCLDVSMHRDDIDQRLGREILPTT